MVSKCRQLALVILLTACSPLLHAADEFNLKANFLYRFAQFTQWPPPPREQARFCLLEHPALFQALQALGLGLDVKVLHDPKMLDQCDVLMLGLSDRQALLQWQNLLANSSVLIVTDNAEAYRQLGMIQLMTSPDGINFKINLARANARQIKLGSQLLKLARQVD